GVGVAEWCRMRKSVSEPWGVWPTRMRLMSWQAPQVSVKRCFIAPSGHSFAVYCACAGAANAIRISASSAHLVGGLPVSLIGMAVLPESDIFPLCFVVGDS